MTDHTHTWTHDTPRVRPDGTRIESGDELTPTDHELRCWPDRLAPADSTCDVEMDNGEVCGRARPCQYHDPRVATADSDEDEEAATDGDEE